MKTINLGTTSVPTALERVQVLNDAPCIAIQSVVTGDPLTITVDYEGSLDGITWGLIESHAYSVDELTALSQYFYVVDKPLPYFRINVSTLTFTTAATVTVIARYNDI